MVTILYKLETYTNRCNLTQMLKMLECKHCQKGFRDKRSLSSHLVVHREKKQRCLECNKLFKRKGDLNVHMLLHSHDKSYTCHECGKLFLRRSNLNSHMHVHSSDRRHKCSVCSRNFKRKSELKEHLSIHSNEKKYECHECKKVFRHLKSLKVHLPVHTGERNFQCNECGKLFARKSNLTSHMLVHTSEKCGECGVKFRLKRDLKAHLQQHDNERNFESNIKHSDYVQIAEESNNHENDSLISSDEVLTSLECNKIIAGKEHCNSHVVYHIANVNQNNLLGNAIADFIKSDIPIVACKKIGKCNICGKHFTDEENTSSHTFSHDCKHSVSYNDSFTSTVSSHIPVCTDENNSSNNYVRGRTKHTVEPPVHNTVIDHLYKCNECNVQFVSKRCLHAHIFGHTDEKKCNDQYQRIIVAGESDKSILENSPPAQPVSPNDCDILKSDLPVCPSGFNGIICNECQQVFSDKETLEMHFVVHETINTKKVNISTMSRELCLNAHMITNNDDAQFQCSKCSELFNTKSMLEAHVHHTEKKTFNSVDSKFHINGSNTLPETMSLKHHHTSNKSFQCSVCSKQFRRKDHLKNHMYVHSEGKKYKCKECGKLFKFGTSVKTHMLIHNPHHKRYKCNGCGKQYTTYGILKTHMLIHCAEKNFTCEMCNKPFKTRSSLNVHILCHNGENLKCTDCGKLFKSRYSLQSHLAVHSDGKHMCGECGKLVTYKSSLNKPLLLCNSEKQVECQACGKLCKNRNFLKRHMILHSDIKLE